MIEKTYYSTRSDGVELYQRKSTLKVKIRQIETGQVYDDPIDIEPCPYTYEETDIPIDTEQIEPEPTDDTEQKAAAFDYLTGRADDE